MSHVEVGTVHGRLIDDSLWRLNVDNDAVKQISPLHVLQVLRCFLSSCTPQTDNYTITRQSQAKLVMVLIESDAPKREMDMIIYHGNGIQSVAFVHLSISFI